MSENKMLIDATHPEETRVVVLRGGRVEEFDYESAARKQLRGNIYLAKVTRVEPALQAAFVDYGGNRHGFLAFNEIHPDYYQIPIADRIALLEEEAAIEAEEEAEADARAERMAARRARRQGGSGEGRNARGEGRSQDDDQSPDDVHDDDDQDGEPEDVHASAPRPADDDWDDDDNSDVEAAGAEADDAVGADAGEASEADEDSETGEGNGPKSIAADMVRDEVISEEPGTVVAAEESADADERTPGDVDEAEAPADDDEPQAASASSEADAVEHVGDSEDALEELPSRPRRSRRSYKIQEVIKRRQVLLIQVVKEERGNKGAALTTYLSLAGRYTVLMPNTARGGGISRKITNPQDRKRLKAIAAELEVPEGMGLIIRTAGAARTKQEIRRDFEYLLRLWESVRELTLQSTAPSLVYEEGDLIKRSIRDLYSKEIDEVIVAGDDAHREAKSFMRMLMPSHAKNVTLYKEPEPLFTRFGIERQLNAMFSPFVTLRSGGYLVINQTEALVAVDVNSGRSTREFSIEETALHTNLEAADEIARHLKLRDLAGLIVIDFIDMEEKRNNRAVERRLKEALRLDRARIQVGRISPFGLLEMSRQRLRTGVLEGSTSQCPHCQGTGIIRSTESIALAVLRGLEDAVMNKQRGSLIANTTAEVALYILNNKREFIIDMEARHGFPIMVQASDKMQGANFTIEKGAAPAQAPAPRRSERTAIKMDWSFDDSEEDTEAPAEAVEEVGAEENGAAGEDENGRRRRRRRRRGRRNGERQDDRHAHAHDHDHEHDDRHDDDVHAHAEGDDGDDDEASAGDVAQLAAAASASGETPSERPSRRRRRGRRGGRRNRERNRGLEAGGEEHGDEGGDIPGFGPQPTVIEISTEPAEAPEAEARGEAEEGSEESRAHETKAKREEAAPAAKAAEPAPAAETEAEPAAEAQPAQPDAPSRRSAPAVPATPRLQRVVVGPDRATETEIDMVPEEGDKPTRKGWWQRKLLGSDSEG